MYHHMISVFVFHYVGVLDYQNILKMLYYRNSPFSNFPLLPPIKIKEENRLRLQRHSISSHLFCGFKQDGSNENIR